MNDSSDQHGLKGAKLPIISWELTELAKLDISKT